ncbi:MAG: MoxR family ATPase [Spirochaetota bacterium]
MAAKLRDATTKIEKLKKEIQKGIVGQEKLIEGLILGMLANGHLLIEGVPGLAKTRAVNLLANSCNVAFKRLQFTPDLLPADIVGTRIFNQNTASFETSLGPIFANFVIADEINRAPAKVQSALLETMQEKQVTIGDETHKLPKPFFVYATMNPVEQEGTYPLPEAQLDRFLMKLVVDYPKLEEERDIVKMVIQEKKIPSVNSALEAEDILALQDITRSVFLEDRLVDYITNIVYATRTPEKYGLNLQNVIQIGASPRASISLAVAARAKAVLEGRDSVIPEDIKYVANYVLRHRIILTYHADAEDIRSEDIIEEMLTKIKVP